MISGAHAYHLHGTRGTVSDLGFGTWAGGYGSEGRSAEITGADLALDVFVLRRRSALQ